MENWVPNQFSWQGKNDFSVQLLKSEKEIAFLQRNFSILNNANVEQRCLEVVVSCVSWRATETVLQDQDRAATGNQDSLLAVIL